MVLMFYNTLTRKKEVFRPIKGKSVGFYSCGPTVYNYPHLGNYRAYIFADVLKRYLVFSGYKVKHIMNITDVDDKTIRDSKKAGMKLKDFTRMYESEFFKDLKSLNILPAEKYPRATEHIKEMVGIIKCLLKKGIAYRGEDGSIYYDISKFKDYGKFAGIKISGLEAGASGRVKADEYAKEDANDFTVWKAWTKDDGDVFWETEIGKGRPGWHIECSAMSMKYLGDTFDLHCGGVDLIFPHHQNEIAQSEGCTGKKFVKYWLHNGWLLVDGQKMSKSLGNFFTLRDILKQGWNPNAVRFLLMSAHYRTELNFTQDALKQATESIKRLDEFLASLKETNGGQYNKRLSTMTESAKKGFEVAMDDDLNTPLALSCIFELVKEANTAISAKDISEKNAKEILDLVGSMDSVLGLGLGHMEWKTAEDADEKTRKLIEQREKFRADKKWADADRTREQLKRQGIILEDTEKGARWRRQ